MRRWMYVGSAPIWQCPRIATCKQEERKTPVRKVGFGRNRMLPGHWSTPARIPSSKETHRVHANPANATSPKSSQPGCKPRLSSALHSLRNRKAPRLPDSLILRQIRLEHTAKRSQKTPMATKAPWAKNTSIGDREAFGRVASIRLHYLHEVHACGQVCDVQTDRR